MTGLRGGQGSRLQFEMRNPLNSPSPDDVCVSNCYANKIEICLLHGLRVLESYPIEYLVKFSGLANRCIDLIDLRQDYASLTFYIPTQHLEAVGFVLLMLGQVIETGEDLESGVSDLALYMPKATMIDKLKVLHICNVLELKRDYRTQPRLHLAIEHFIHGRDSEPVTPDSINDILAVVGCAYPELIAGAVNTMISQFALGETDIDQALAPLRQHPELHSLITARLRDDEASLLEMRRYTNRLALTRCNTWLWQHAHPISWSDSEELTRGLSINEPYMASNNELLEVQQAPPRRSILWLLLRGVILLALGIFQYFITFMPFQ